MSTEIPGVSFRKVMRVPASHRIMELSHKEASLQDTGIGPEDGMRGFDIFYQ